MNKYETIGTQTTKHSNKRRREDEEEMRITLENILYQPHLQLYKRCNCLKQYLKYLYFSVLAELLSLDFLGTQTCQTIIAQLKCLEGDK